uniref:Caudal type homeobox 2 n=1 Tax=Equus caballus TaxID=9796 RepID=A0A9L0RF64_HORSE
SAKGLLQSKAGGLGARSRGSPLVSAEGEGKETLVESQPLLHTGIFSPKASFQGSRGCVCTRVHVQEACSGDVPTKILVKTRTKDKYRVVYTDHQRLELEKEFHYSRYITIRRKAELAATLGLSERQVKIWFQNRRAKERKINKKKLQQQQQQQQPPQQPQQPPPAPQPAQPQPGPLRSVPEPLSPVSSLQGSVPGSVPGVLGPTGGVLNPTVTQ